MIWQFWEEREDVGVFLDESLPWGSAGPLSICSFILN